MARPIKDPTADAISGLSKVIEAASSQQKPSSELAKAITQTTEGLAAKTVRLYGIGSNPKALSSDLAAIQKMASKLEKDNHISFADVATDIARYVPAPAANLYFGNGQSDKWELGLDQAVASGILDQIKLNPLDSYKDPSPPVSHPHPAYGKRRLSTSARAASAAASMPAVLNSGNVTPGATFQPFQPTGEVPDLNNPPRFTPQTQTGGGGRPPVPPSWWWWETADLPTVDERQQSTADRAAERAEEARRIVEDTAMSGGGRIPPAPPGGNDPPGPPDEPEDDDGILRQLLEFFQRMFGVRPDIANRNFLDTLANNLTSILGGVPAQAGADGQRPSSVATLMDTFADYFNVPRETEDATRAAQETLRRSIDRLTEATNGAANGGTPSQPQTRWQRFRGFFRRGRTRRGGIATATRIATYMRPVLTRIGNILPRGVRNTAAQFGQNVVGRMAQRYGIPAATAARFGAALGPAAVGLGAVLYALPLIGAAATFAVKGLMYLSSESMKTTMRLVNYSGLLSHANANLEVNRVLRDFRAAQAIQGRGAARIRLKDQIENEWAPISIAITKIGNEFGQLFDNVTLFGLKSAKAIAGIQNEQESQFFESMRNIMAFSRVLLGMGIMPDLNGNQDDQDLRRFAGREAIFGQNAVDMVDFNRRQRGPRRPVNPNGGGN